MWGTRASGLRHLPEGTRDVHLLAPVLLAQRLPQTEERLGLFEPLTPPARSAAAPHLLHHRSGGGASRGKAQQGCAALLNSMPVSPAFYLLGVYRN
jgi:hypothetical protein